MDSEIEVQLEEIWQTIDRFLEQRPLRKNLEGDITKELKKIKRFFCIILSIMGASK